MYGSEDGDELEGEDGALVDEVALTSGRHDVHQSIEEEVTHVEEDDSSWEKRQKHGEECVECLSWNIKMNVKQEDYKNLQ